MSAGLPGLGLGGLFFILCALFVAPTVEAVRTVRGKSSLEAWRMVGRQFVMALGMVAVIDATLRVMTGLLGDAESGAADGLTGPALQPIAIAVLLLTGLLLTAKVVALALKPRPARPTRVASRVYRAGRRLVFERGGS